MTDVKPSKFAERAGTAGRTSARNRRSRARRTRKSVKRRKAQAGRIRTVDTLTKAKNLAISSDFRHRRFNSLHCVWQPESMQQS